MSNFNGCLELMNYLFEFLWIEWKNIKGVLQAKSSSKLKNLEMQHRQHHQPPHSLPPHRIPRPRRRVRMGKMYKAASSRRCVFEWISIKGEDEDGLGRKNWEWLVRWRCWGLWGCEKWSREIEKKEREEKERESSDDISAPLKQTATSSSKQKVIVPRKLRGPLLQLLSKVFFFS